MGVIPDNYSLTYGSGPQIIHVDTAVTRTGKPSIRLDQHTASDVNSARECDGTWYNIKPGNHLVAKAWIKTSTSSLSDTDYRHGGRIGIDFYAHTSAGYGLIGSADEVSGATCSLGIPGQDCALNWNKDWTQKGWDIIVPSTYYTRVRQAGGLLTCNPVQIDSFVVWLDVRPIADAGHVWFCDGEIYINPNSSDSPSTGSVLPTPPPPQSGQIAVSSVTASSYSDGHPPGLAVDGVESPDNYWGTNAGVPQGVVPQWLRLDLGSVYAVNSVVTHFYDGSVRTYTYYIQVSNDGSSWTTVVSTKTGSGSVTDSFSQVGARFVRITITANTANPAAHIEEAKVYGPSSVLPTPPPPQNVQIPVSSVTASSYSDGHPPGLAVDGVESPDNYWGTNAGVPQGVVPQWLRLDLGSVHTVNAVVTHFYDGSVRTYTYYVQVSNDGSSWTTVVSTKTGSGSVTDSFSQVGARFVRITITANTANPAAHIEEIKVYGPS